MATKTLKFFGNGYAPTGQSASVTVTLDGATVFTGAVPSLPSAQWDLQPDVQVELFSIDIDDTFVGVKPMTVTTTNGDAVVLSWCESNSAATPSVFYSMAEADLQWDYRTNVQLDGVPQDKGSLVDILVGAWSWEVPNGSTLSYDLNVSVPAPLPPLLWNSTSNYSTGQVVELVSGGQRYQAIAYVPSNNPPPDATYWVTYP